MLKTEGGGGDKKLLDGRGKGCKSFPAGWDGEAGGAQADEPLPSTKLGSVSFDEMPLDSE